MGSSNSEEKDNETTFKSSLQNSSSVSSTWESSFSPSSMKPEKQKRVQEFYAKLEAEEKQKEDARRNVPFKSSLLSAINQPISASVSRFPPSRSIGSVIAPPPIQQQIQPKFPAASVAQASGFKSSLRASMSMTSSFARGNANKITYSVEQLRELRQRAIAPKALIDMTIVQREQVRDPSSVQRGLISSRTIAARERERVTRAGKGLISPPIASKSSFRLERKEAKRGNRSEMRGAKGRGGDGRGRGGRRGRERQPEPVFDGPVEPLVLSENRWVPKKGKSALESTLSIVKGLLNKLTREKFKKLTDELVSVEIQDLETLSSIVSVIMNKALEEPNFSDVYADLSKEFHVRTGTKVWHFLRTVENIDNHVSLTVILSAFLDLIK
jgi:ribosomal protein L15